MNHTSSRWSLKRFAVPAWIGSVLFHLFVLVAILLFLAFRPAPASPPGEKEATGGIVLKQQSEDGTDYFDSDNAFHGEARPEVGEEAAADALSDQALSAEFSSVDLPEMPTVAAIGPSAARGDAPNVPGGGDLATLLANRGSKSPGLGNDPGGKARQSVFGIENEGHRFVYVFDRSGSMQEHGGRPMQAARAVLLRNIDGLGDWHQFNIIFYNEKPSPWQSGKMIFANQANRNSAKRFVEGMTAMGGTRHREPLSMAVRLKPDVIFFLTDGDDQDRLTPGQLQEIERLNGRSGAGAVINVIQFGVGQRSGSAYLKDLARQNDGKFVYINIADLPGQ